MPGHFGEVTETIRIGDVRILRYWIIIGAGMIENTEKTSGISS